MKLVKQTGNDCSIACIAMLSGRALEEVSNLLPRPINEGLYLDDVRGLLFKVGLQFIQYTDFITIHGRTYLLTVPSKSKTQWHDIVLSYSEEGVPTILDPLEGISETYTIKDLQDKAMIHQLIEILNPVEEN